MGESEGQGDGTERNAPPGNPLDMKAVNPDFWGAADDSAGMLPL